LTEQSDLLIALPRQLAHFGNDVLGSAAPLFAASIRHDTISAKFVAAVHNVDPCPKPFPFLGHVLDNVAFLGPYLDYKLLAKISGLQQLRQSVNIMRAKDHIDERMFLQYPPDDRLLLRHAAAYAEQQSGFFLLEYL
jgi:hypothetical protein